MDANLAANAARETVLQTVKQHLDLLKQIDDLVAQYSDSTLVNQFGASIGESVVRETTEMFELLLDAALRSIASRVEPTIIRAPSLSGGDTPALPGAQEFLSRVRATATPTGGAT